MKIFQNFLFFTEQGHSSNQKSPCHSAHEVAAEGSQLAKINTLQTNLISMIDEESAFDNADEPLIPLEIEFEATLICALKSSGYDLSRSIDTIFNFDLVKK